jgi:hypothetical protein
MIGDKIIEINQFCLSYDGLFTLNFSVNGKSYTLHPYLTPRMIIEIIKNEGLEFTSEITDLYSRVEFTQTTLLLEVFEEENGSYSFLTSERGEMYQDIDLYLVHVKIKD